MSGTILQAEIDSNHQFVREKVVSHGQVAQNEQLVLVKTFFRGQLAHLIHLSVKWVYFTDKLVSEGAITGST